MQVRRFVLIVLGGGVLALPAWGAQGTALGTADSVQLSLKDGHGFATVASHGTLLGRVRRGRIVATRNVFVGHWASKRRVSDNLVAYRGRRMTLRVFSSDGAWRVRLWGRGINVSGVVRGSLTLDGVESGATGRYSIDGGEPDPWPRTRETFALRD